MPRDDELLRNITTFPKLVKYLRDELQWPIEETSFDDLTFDYEPEELGLDPKTAVKVRSIKQLRPLTAGQPWGVFFVEFERKRLPVVVMRRILSALALKKRASAGKSDQAAWRASDLLFISSFGEEGGRGITFAHFAPDDQGHDLPALKVLGWDGDDTKLHTQAVAESLASSLTWPSNARDVNAWRTQWSSAFVLANREVVTTSRELSIQLAKLAVGIREQVKTLLVSESDRGPLRKLHKAFKEALLHDLDEDGFADMYAQTVAYGLLAAKLENPDSPTPLTASALADMIPPTSPFLKGLLSTFLKVGGRKGYLDFDELGIDDIVDLLRNAKMKAILLDFGDLKPEEDPVLHFYELFLNGYDHAQRVSRGVFYTPKPVVHYIVRSIDEILRTEFGLLDGLADTTTWGEMASRRPGLAIPKGSRPDQPFIQILDPATGTATFLVEVIDVIYSTMTAKWHGQGRTKTEIEGLWNEYVPRHLLPRLYGFELQMAPYTIAHIKVGLKLRETGYQFESTQRLRIYLTNSLEDPIEFSDPLGLLLPALADEARAVAAVKLLLKPTVVLGNPPYSGTSTNNGGWIVGLIKDYKQVDGKPLGERNPKWLQDDYVKFFRFVQWKIDRAGIGVLGLITNHSYLDNPTFRGMRQSLMGSFDQLYFLDLHGNSLKKERCPDGSKDENVFDIQQGVAVSLLLKQPKRGNGRSVTCHADCWGSREAKYSWLDNHGHGLTDHWEQLLPESPSYLFVPRDSSMAKDYLSFPSMKDIFGISGVGMTTARDEFVIDTDRTALLERIRLLKHDKGSDEELHAHSGIRRKNGWSIRKAWEMLQSLSDRQLEGLVVPVLYRPFDVRWIFYHDSVVWRTVKRVMCHMLSGDNVAIIAPRQFKEKAGAFVTSTVATHKTVSAYDINTVFPLYVFEPPDNVGQDAFESAVGQPRLTNLNSRRVVSIGRDPGLCILRDGHGNPADGSTSPEALFAYIYAILYSPSYRALYSQFLKSDFPRIPFAKGKDTFCKLVKLGQHLINLHLIRSPELDSPISRFCGKGGSSIRKIGYSTDERRVSINMTQYFDDVEPDTWSYQIGGYQVLLKWLQDRGPKGGKPGRVLSADDILHYRKIVTAIAKTIELQAEIDRVIATAGGFPAAFVTGEP